MKFLILSSLLSLALGSTERGLALNKYYVGEQLQLELYEPENGVSDSFKLTAEHNKADTTGGNWAGSRYIYLFAECPHGAGPDQAKEGDANFLGRIATFDNGEVDTTTANWIERIVEVDTTPAVSDPTWKWYSEVAFKVLPSAIDVAAITTKLDDTETDVARVCDDGDVACAEAAGVENYDVEFCLLFGLGPSAEADYPSDGGARKLCNPQTDPDCFPDDAFEVYGFREIILKAKFTFDGNFECTSFETQAFNPQTGDVETNKHYQAVATNCSPQDPIRPGKPVCIQICADPTGDRDAFIDYIKNLYFCEDSNPDTTAPDETFVLLGGVNGGAVESDAARYVYPMLQVNCDDENDTFGDETGDWNWGTPTMDFGCCRATVTLPARYFATVQGAGTADGVNTDIFNPTNPKKATFKACGDVKIRPMAEGDEQWGPKAPDGSPRGGQSMDPPQEQETSDAGNGNNGNDMDVGNEQSDTSNGQGAGRRLQQSTTVIDDSASISGDLTYTLAPAEDSSSKKTFVAGAAAIVAGAALLI